MNEESIRYCTGVFDQIEEAVDILGMELQRLELKDTRGIPTGILTFVDEARKGWAISCTVVATHVNEISTGLVYLYMQLNQPAPEKRAELEAFAKGCNDMYLLGSLSVVEDSLALKYLMALEPAEPLNQDHFQTTVFTLIREANNIIRQVAKLCDGTMTVEQALNFSAIQ